MKAVSWVELTNPMTTPQSGCETAKMPENTPKGVSACKSEFHVELSSRLASHSTAVSYVDEGRVARSGNPCCHESITKGCHETSGGNEEDDLEDEGKRGRSGGVGDLGAGEDVLVRLLQAIQMPCGAGDFPGFSSAEAMEKEVTDGKDVTDSIDEVAEFAEGARFHGASPQQDCATAVMENQVFDGENMAFELPEADIIASYEFGLPARLGTELTTEPYTQLSAEPSGDQVTEPTTEPFTEVHTGLFYKVSTEQSAELDTQLPVGGVSAESLAAPLVNTNRHEKVSATDNVDAVENVDTVDNGVITADNSVRVMSQGEGDFARYDRGDVVIHEIVYTQSYGLHGGQSAPTFSLNSQQILHEEVHGFSKLSKLEATKYVDSHDKLLLPRDMQVPSETHKAPGGEREMRDTPGEIAVALGDKRKPIAKEKAHPIKGLDRSRFAQTLGVSSTSYEGAAAPEGVSNLGGTYPKLNQGSVSTGIVNQIVNKAQLRLGREQAQMVIDLKPDILGRVHLKISQEAGKVVAEIRAESASTKALIESGLSDLKTALSEKGFSFDALTISWSSSRGSGGAGPGGDSLSWFSEPNGWGHDDEVSQTATLTNSVDSEETVSLVRLSRTRTYLLDYTA